VHLDEIYILPLDEIYILPLDEIYILPLDEIYILPLDEIYILPLDEIYILPRRILWTDLLKVLKYQNSFLKKMCPVGDEFYSEG